MLIKFQLLMKDNNVQNTWGFSLPRNLSSYTHRKGRICSVPLKKRKATWKCCRELKGKCLILAHCSKKPIKLSLFQLEQQYFSSSVSKKLYHVPSFNNKQRQCLLICISILRRLLSQEGSSLEPVHINGFPCFPLPIPVGVMKALAIETQVPATVGTYISLAIIIPQTGFHKAI